jgi:glycerol-3-phosphate acyltransferase PlsY
VVLAADIGKGAVAAGAGLLMGGWWAGCAGLVLAMAGHAWPPWSGFRGGRSVACLIGGGLVLGPLPAAIAIGLFLLLRRPLGLGRTATIGLLSYPPLFWALAADRWRLIGIGVAYLTLVAAWMHFAQRRKAAAA